MRKIKGVDNSGTLFNNIKEKRKFLRETDLAEYLDEHLSIISEIRHGKREINDKMLVRIIEKTGMSFKSVKAQIAERG